MYQNKIKLMPQDILEKEFKIDTRGYRLKEVDQFLDDIIGDYEQFLNIINNLEKEKADLLAEIVNLNRSYVIPNLIWKLRIEMELGRLRILI